MGLAGALLVAGNVAASDFIYEYNYVYTGAAPASSPPWVSAFFEDVSPGTVNLTISNLALTGGEFVSEMDFNLNPAMVPTNLMFANIGGSGDFILPTITTGSNQFMADGDGKFDIMFSFSTTDGSGNRFSDSKYVSYQITGITGLVASDFAYPSLPDGGAGPLYAAGHIQGITGGTTSGWVTIPEPASFSLLSLAACLWFGTRPWLKPRAKTS
jgi:hypothetical protein